MYLIRFLTVMSILALFPGASYAKWWIFGQSENEISTRYLFLNGVSYDELGDQVTIYRETLENGLVTIRGKAATKSSMVGSVQISIDGKEIWQKARKASDGSFEYSFRPETGRKYSLYVKIIDTTGKTNEVEGTRKEITVSEQNISSLIRQVMDALIEAYQSEDPGRFMALVSEDFAGDATVLDRAIRKDFNLFDGIDLRYVLNNVTAAGGKIYAGFTFSRKLTSSQTGQTLSDKGSSEFIFSLGAKGPLVSGMKYPLIFGLSDASNVATGVINSNAADPVIVVTSKGDVIAQPFPDAVKTVENDGVVQSGTDTVESGSFTLACAPSGPGIQCEGFDFASGDVVTFSGDITLEFNILFIKENVSFKELGIVGINSIHEAPANGYTVADVATSFWVQGREGNVYAFLLSNGKYALLEIVSYTDLGAGNTRSTYRYKYQPDGTRNF